MKLVHDMMLQFRWHCCCCSSPTCSSKVPDCTAMAPPCSFAMLPAKTLLPLTETSVALGRVTLHVPVPLKSSSPMLIAPPPC